MSKYLVIFEQMEHNWGAHSPDVPGCVATGASQEETEQNFREALQFHFEGLRRHGLPIPEPVASASYVVIEG